MFADELDGRLFSLSPGAIDADLVCVAKQKTAPDIFTERAMRGPEWDTSKQLEVENIKVNAGVRVVAEDDPSIKHMRPVPTMWTGRTKRNAAGEIIQSKGPMNLDKVSLPVMINFASRAEEDRERVADPR